MLVVRNRPTPDHPNARQAAMYYGDCGFPISIVARALSVFEKDRRGEKRPTLPADPIQRVASHTIITHPSQSPIHHPSLPPASRQTTTVQYDDCAVDGASNQSTGRIRVVTVTVTRTDDKQDKTRNRRKKRKE